jgi:P-type Ca2+ transporter type 2B
MRIPADCVLISGTDIACDESAMTGEPDASEKTGLDEHSYSLNPNPFLLAKTLVETGQGKALVCAVGVNTRSGMAEEKLNIEEDETPLQYKLETIASQIGEIGVYVAIITFIVMTIKLIIVKAINDQQTLISVETLQSVVKFIIIGITVIVVAVPEGLPLAVTISLAFSVMKMKQENNLVRKLEASETMGGATQICTDKTGTLTQNKMTVRAVYVNDQVFHGKPPSFNQLQSA